MSFRLYAAAVVASSALLALTIGSASAAEVVAFPDENDRAEAPDDAEAPEETHEGETKAEPRARVRKRRRTLIGDLNSRWFHIGGGMGAIADPYSQQGSLAGRFILGGGAYTIGLYGGGGMEITGSAIQTPSISAVGNVGFAIPVPVVHPMVGLRGLVGLHPTSGGDSLLAPHVGAGLQAGFIIREFDGRPGLRLMVDTGVEYRPDTQMFLPDAFVTLAAVF